MEDSPGRPHSALCWMQSPRAPYSKAGESSVSTWEGAMNEFVCTLCLNSVPEYSSYSIVTFGCVSKMQIIVYYWFLSLTRKENHQELAKNKLLKSWAICRTSQFVSKLFFFSTPKIATIHVTFAGKLQKTNMSQYDSWSFVADLLSTLIAFEFYLYPFFIFIFNKPSEEPGAVSVFEVSTNNYNAY